MESIKEKAREKYGEVALLQESCCTPGECCAPGEAAEIIGFRHDELAAVPQESILGAG